MDRLLLFGVENSLTLYKCFPCRSSRAVMFGGSRNLVPVARNVEE